MPPAGDLQQRFGIPSAVRIDSPRGGLVRIVISTDLCNGEIYLQGGHITQFQPRLAAPVLFLSKASKFESGKAIRGGIPLIFPWFGSKADDASAPAHGFARSLPWDIESIDQRGDSSVRVVLHLVSSQETLQRWPHEFSLRLIAIFASSLDITLETRNTSKDAFEFEHALHTYFTVGDIHTTTIEGLSGVEYFDKVDGFKRKRQSDPVIRVTGETDRVYLNTQHECIIRDPAMNRAISVEKEDSNSTVVWNPWIAKSKSMSDFGDDEWTSMLCVETGNITPSAVRLPAGSTHRMRATLRRT